MRTLDEEIRAALSAEEAELLRTFGAEPGWVSQAMGLFRGRLGWVMGLTFGAALLAFAGFVYALVQTLTAQAALPAVQWGVGAVLLFQLTTFLRSFMGTHLEANRTIREMRRLELRLIPANPSPDPRAEQAAIHQGRD